MKLKPFLYLVNELIEKLNLSIVDGWGMTALLCKKNFVCNQFTQENIILPKVSQMLWILSKIFSPLKSVDQNWMILIQFSFSIDPFPRKIFDTEMGNLLFAILMSFISNVIGK